MSNYRNFKFPFGGTGYVDPSNPTPDLQSILAYQDNLPVAKNAGGVQLVNNPRQYLQEYTERVRPELERKVAEVNKQYSNVPKGGTIVRNHDKMYDYYKDGDRLYYRKKGGKNWIDISDNELAQKRINATIARNKRSYGTKKVASQNVEDNKTYDAGTLNDIVITGKKRNKPTNNKSYQKPTNNTRVAGAKAYLADVIAQLPANYNKPRIDKMTKTAVTNRDAGRKKGGFVGWFMNGIR